MRSTAYRPTLVMIANSAATAAEHQQQQAHRRLDQGQLGWRHLGDALRQLGHVQRAQRGIQQAQRDQEQGRGGDVEHHVVQADAHAHAAAAAEQQAIGGDQHHLEEHEQVEDVAGQEGAVEADQLELEQRMEVRRAAVPARAGMQQAGDGQQQGGQQHPRRQPVGHQRDAQPRRPVAQQVDVDLTAGGGGEQQPHRQGQRRQRGPGHRALHPGAIRAVFAEQRQRSTQQRNQDRQDHQMVHARSSPWRGGMLSSCRSSSGSWASTWSLWLSLRLRMASTMLTAVIANAMTMAVSTSACGSASV
ncbi:hypothetical protein G6F40_013511 [Rhizopus arrhizus]|nr:hypothetical protein G6F40_013511 [Rhizopus arrhizus]